MKNSSLFTFIVLGTTFLVSCSNGAETDSKKIADSTNTARIDSAKSVDTSNSPQTTMADLKRICLQLQQLMVACWKWHWVSWP
jgi:hypothetical protein